MAMGKKRFSLEKEIALMFRYSGQATKFEKNPPLVLTFLSKFKKAGRFFSNFCGLLRIYELY